MRIAFVETLMKLAEEDPRVWLVTGDLGFSVFEGFIERYPERYLNVGVAEQDMIGVSAGLALTGLRPFVYSISTFASMRAYEQIRDDICYQDLPVVVIGGGSAFSYSTFGATHMPLEDLAIMRALPRMNVCAPGDPVEVRVLLRALHEAGAPGYMRIAKRGEPVVHADEQGIALGKMSLMRDGNDVTLIVSGKQLPNALSAAELLAADGINARVLSFHTLKPLDTDAVIAAAHETRGIVTIEEHSRIGGTGSAVLEALADAQVSATVARLGVPDEFPKGVGKEAYFLARYGLTPEHIAASARAAIARA